MENKHKCNSGLPPACQVDWREFCLRFREAEPLYFASGCMLLLLCSPCNNKLLSEKKMRQHARARAGGSTQAFTKTLQHGAVFRCVERCRVAAVAESLKYHSRGRRKRPVITIRVLQFALIDSYSYFKYFRYLPR